MILSTEQVTKKYCRICIVCIRGLVLELFTWVHEVLSTTLEKYIHIHSFPFGRIFYPNLEPFPHILIQVRKAAVLERMEGGSLRQMIKQKLLESQAERCREEKGGTFRNVGKFLPNMSKRYPCHSTRDGVNFQKHCKGCSLTSFKE